MLNVRIILQPVLLGNIVLFALEQKQRSDEEEGRLIVKDLKKTSPTKSRMVILCDNIKQLLDEVFVICRIINVEVRVISRAEGEADNSYRDIDNFAYHKNRIQ